MEEQALWKKEEVLCDFLFLKKNTVPFSRRKKPCRKRQKS
jgi:hypothetical protein